MQCNFPVYTYRLDGTPACRPCGSCMGCRLEYARGWAVRCVHEAQFHDVNSFLTLTLNNDNLPHDRSVDKKVLSDFMREYRRKIEPVKIRFFGCGEYGEAFSRPHYHVAIFGHRFENLQMLRAQQRRSFGRKHFKVGYDNDLYKSSDLEKIWGKGFCTIGDLTFESAGYVARYVTKKITGKTANDHYKERKPEFALMSRNPGIGNKWIEKYIHDVYPKDYFTINGNKCRPPRYYDTYYEKHYPAGWKKLKQKRRIKADEIPIEEPLRDMHKEKHLNQTTKTLERKLENGQSKRE